MSRFPKDVEVGGVNLGIRLNPGEDWICKFYLQIKQEGLLPIFFHNTPTISIGEFLVWAKATFFLACFMNPTLDSGELLGAVFVNKALQFGDDVSVEVGEGFFRKTQPRVTEAFARLGMSFCFDALGVVAMYGVTPVENRAALVFPKRLGFDSTQPLPGLVGWGGRSSEGVIYYITREKWEKLSGKVSE